jgi:hypothetical protein
MVSVSYFKLGCRNSQPAPVLDEGKPEVGQLKLTTVSFLVEKPIFVLQTERLWPL